jgi:hypothetical protein
MGFFHRATKIVDLGDGNTVTLRKAAFRESQEAASAASSVKDGTITIDWPLYRLELLKRCVTAWEGEGFDGLPPTPENIDQLPISIGNKLADEVQELSTLSDSEGN